MCAYRERKKGNRERERGNKTSDRQRYAYGRMHIDVCVCIKAKV